jgi:predicted CXXCH cytochrome family protein
LIRLIRIMENKTLIRIAVLMALLGLMLLSCAINIREYARFMPEGMKECSLCHTLDDSGMVAEKGRELVDSTEEMCAACHEARIKEGEHPVGAVQKAKTELPLYEGKVECLTCHEPHGRGGNHAMLRLSPETLCSACHDY